MRQFVPMTDDMLDDAGRLSGPLVPYQCGVPCWHRLRVEPERQSQPQPLALPPPTTPVDGAVPVSA